MSNRIHAVRGAVALATLAMAFAAPLHAQATFDSRWQAWFGCWQPSDASALAGAKPSAMCVAPVNSTSAVEVTVIQDGAVTTRDTIDASGVARNVDKQGCKGTETGNWSIDNRRVFLHSVLTCEGGLSRTGNTIVAMTPAGDWVNVQTLTVGTSTGVRAIHYRDANSLNVAPPAVAEAIKDRQLAINAARADAGTTLDINTVLEAVQRTDTTAVQSWIVERGTRFNLDARQLVALANAGIPGSVTDVMIGVSYPDHFALKAPQPNSALGAGFADMGSVGAYDRTACPAAIVSMYGRAGCSPCGSSWDYDPFFFSGYNNCGLSARYGYSPYSRYSPYYSPYGYGYGYGSYYPYYGYSSAPVVVVKGEEQQHGRVVNGHGYTQRPTSTGRSSDPFPASSSTYSGSTGSSAGGSSSGGGGGGSSSGSSSSGGEQRTAHPRPPM